MFVCLFVYIVCLFVCLISCSQVLLNADPGLFACLFVCLFILCVCLFVLYGAAASDLMLTLEISRFHAAASLSVQLHRSKSETSEIVLTQIHILDEFSQL